MTSRSLVRLPKDVSDDFEVYVNGIPQREYIDFQIEGHTLVFERSLRKDKISGWRWLLGALGSGTYRQDDTVDIRYETDDGMCIAHGLPITGD